MNSACAVSLQNIQTPSVTSFQRKTFYLGHIIYGNPPKRLTDFHNFFVIRIEPGVLRVSRALIKDILRLEYKRVVNGNSYYFRCTSHCVNFLLVWTVMFHYKVRQQQNCFCVNVFICRPT